MRPTKERRVLSTLRVSTTRSTMASESKLAELILEEVQAELDERGWDDLTAKANVKIIKDCTVLPKDGGFSMLLGHAEADVAVYLEPEPLSQELQEGERFKLYNNGDKQVRIPFVIVEVKRDNVNTDNIRSRTIIARESKEIFPFLGYFFVADGTGKTSDTLYRQGKHFDGFFVDESRVGAKWVRENVIENGVSPHLDRLESQGILPDVEL